MAYNNYFPATYQNPYQVQQWQQPTQQTQASGIIWVQGEAGAKSYLVAPNTTVQLWDSESQKIFLKSADASGMPSIKTLEYTIVGGANNAPEAVASKEYVLLDDFNALQDELESLRARVDKMTTRRRRTEDSDE